MAIRKIFHDKSAENLKDKTYIKEALALLEKYAGSEVTEEFEKEFINEKD